MLGIGDLDFHVGGRALGGADPLAAGGIADIVNRQLVVARRQTRNRKTAIGAAEDGDAGAFDMDARAGQRGIAALVEDLTTNFSGLGRPGQKTCGQSQGAAPGQDRIAHMDIPQCSRRGATARL